MTLLERPLLFPFLALASGLALSDQSGFQLPLYAVVAILLCLALSCLGPRRGLFVCCLFLSFLALGLCALSPWKIAHYPSESIHNCASTLPVTLEGIVRSRPIVSPARRLIRCKW